MAKNNSQKKWQCTECGYTAFGGYVGKCPKCQSFGTFVEAPNEEAQETAKFSGLKVGTSVKPAESAKTLSELDKKKIKRFKTGIGELDRVLGGGFVQGEVVLLAGAPGSGKSTLCLRVAELFAKAGADVLYASGEESDSQIKLRADRMGVTEEKIRITHESNLERLHGHVEEINPKFMIVDSLQTLASGKLGSSIGGIQQSKEAAHSLTRLAKTQNITMILVNQINKDGDFAGSEAIQHIVDATLIFESDRDSPLKFLRANKNRFGNATEVGIFQHSETGLEEVADPSGVLLDEGSPLAGEATGFISEGIRQIPVEIQALVADSSLTNPRKQFTSVDNGRGQIICAILDKFSATRLSDNDVFVSTLAGIRVKDPLTDLAIAAAILSSSKDQSTKGKTAFIGEMSLTGRIRGSMIGAKIKEAERLGFDRVVIPKSAKDQIPKNSSIKVDTIDSIKDLARLI